MSTPPPSRDGLPPFPVPEDDEDNLAPDDSAGADLSSASADIPDISNVESGIDAAANSLDRAAEKLGQTNTAQIDAIQDLTSAVNANTAAIQGQESPDSAQHTGAAAQDLPDANAFNSMLDDHIDTPAGVAEENLREIDARGTEPDNQASNREGGPSLFDADQERVHAQLGKPSPNQDVSAHPIPPKHRRNGDNVVATGDRVWRGLEAARYATSSISSNIPQGSLGPGMIAPVAGGAINGAMAGAAIGGPVGAGVGAAAGAAVSAINAMGEAARAAATNLGQYSATMSMANAEADIRQVKGDLNRAQAVAPEVARYTEATSKLSQSAQDLQAAVLQAALKQALPLLESLVNLIETHGAAATEQLSGILEMLSQIIDGLAEWGVVSPMVAAIARGMADAARNLREMNDRERLGDGVEVDQFMAEFLAGGGTGDDPARPNPAPMNGAQGVGGAVGGLFGPGGMFGGQAAGGVLGGAVGGVGRGI